MLLKIHCAEYNIQKCSQVSMQTSEQNLIYLVFFCLYIWSLVKEVITYRRLGPWQRCFCGERQCFWPHTCSCPCPPAGLFWWQDYGQVWWKNWGRSLGRSRPRFSATPPENMFQWSKIHCISNETVSSSAAQQWPEIIWRRVLHENTHQKKAAYCLMQKTNIKNRRAKGDTFI